MQRALLDFNTRVEEIDAFFNFIQGLENEKIQLMQIEEDDNTKIETIDSNLAKTLKANGFLLLYNLVESSMRNAIESIFDELTSNQVPYDAVRVEVKKVILQNFKNRSPDNVHTQLNDISRDIIKAGFNPRELFSGNIDRQEIVKTARKYGFSCDTDYAQTKHGENLYVVRKNRDDLSPG